MTEAKRRDDHGWDGIARAGRILFGARAEALLGGGAWRAELKRAYRRRALETHPDRARSLGRAEAELAREFTAVVEAYRILLEAQEVAAPRARPPAPGRKAPAPPPRKAPPPRAPPRGAGPPERPPRREPVRPAPRAEPPPPPRPASRAQRAAPAPIPPRYVRLGEYLYYSRRIPFEALIEAIAWQRTQRPRVGRLAVECGFLTPEEVLEVIDRRLRAGALDVPFAEYATRIGLLTPFARLALLGRQAHLQRRIGRFFVERGWLTEAELTEARVELRRHNVGYPQR